MILFRNIKIGPKLMGLLFLTATIPLLISALLYSQWLEHSLVEQSFSKLRTIQELRKGQVESYFDRVLQDIETIADSDRIHTLFALISKVGSEISSSPGQGYSLNNLASNRAYTRTKESLVNYINRNGYEDLYIIDADYGDVLFSTGKTKEIGENLITGKMANSQLAQTWSETVRTKATVISDFAPYPPAANEQMALISHPIFNLSGNTIGIVCLRFGAKWVSHIVESTKGMGKTGESYLIGWLAQEDKFLLRSNLKTMGNGQYVIGHDLGRKLDYWVDAVEKGYDGGHNIYIDSVGSKVLIAFDKLKVDGLSWYLISKIDKYEITEPIRVIYKKLAIVSLILVSIICLLAWLLSKHVTRPIVAEMEFANAIANRKFGDELQIRQNDEIGELAHSLNNMSKSLQEVHWLKSGKEQLDDTARGEQNPREIAKKCLRFLIKHLDAELGAMYRQDKELLTLRVSYAFTDREGNFNSFKLGEGMVGQAALEAEFLFFSKINEATPQYNYGAGEQQPSFFVAAPLIWEEKSLGVMLIGSMSPFTELQKSFLQEAIPNLATLINAAESRQKIADLLARANQQQEELKHANSVLEEQALHLQQSKIELQSQQEELKVTNEVLEEQTQALKISEAELQAQQEELRVTNEELEERTSSLEIQKQEIWAKNSSLLEAQEAVEKKMEELEVASKYKSEFLANMSHELRTPLNSILILSQLLNQNKEDNLNKKQVESAGAIYSSGCELLSLINEILDLAKVEAGKIDLNLEEVSLTRIKEDVTTMFKDVANDKGIDFAIDIADDLPGSIITDPQRLQQIIRNLLTNAFKFTSQGAVNLSISRPKPELILNTNLEASHSLAFAIQDEGIGIPKDKQLTIFEAFQQADGSTSRQYGGTGLGLSISKELAKLLGGVIRLHSVENQGSTFTFILPDTPKDSATQGHDIQSINTTEVQGGNHLEQISHDAPPPVEQEQLIDSDSEVIDDRKIIDKDTKSLLIIEDDNKFSATLRDFGRDHGFKCIIAENGEKGLHFADYYNPSAIILDIGLPGIDGWTVMERLKNNPKLRHIPVHFMSASDSSMDAMRMGAIGYMTKPVSIEKIEETLNSMEKYISASVSRLLLVEDNETQRNSIKELIGETDVDTTAVSSGKEAYEELKKTNYDCMILDLGLEDMSGFELLEKIQQDETLDKVPVIIYTGKELTKDEEKQLNTYAETIIIKGAKSPERLLDESALFLHRVEANLPEEKQQMLKMMHDKETVLSNKTILLVDDDMRNVFALSSVLEERNIEIIIARDGIECLEKLESEEKIDGVLMDIMMPRMDGYTAMQEIRKQAKFNKLPIIALTAKAMKGDRSKCIEAGANDYLAKPVNPDKLISMLRVWLYS